MDFSAEFDKAAGRLALAGSCRMADVPVLESALERARQAVSGTLAVSVSGAEAFDIGPAWLLHGFLAELRGRGTSVQLSGELPAHFKYLDELSGSAPEPGAAPAVPEARLVTLGRSIVERLESWYSELVFGGKLLGTAGRAFHSRRRLRIPSIVRHAYETGVQAIPIVSVIAFLISVISAYIGAQQLRPFGAEIFTVDLVAIGVLRELGVLLTAIMVAGRTGSAYAAEIGVMKLNEEVDALESMGLDPYEVLVLPRVLGLVIALPLLTVVADFMGLAGGGMLTRYLLDLPWPQFFTRLEAALGHTTFWAGLIKAPVFGALIGLTGTLRGLQVRESSRELGRLTTVAVVQSIFLVIFADALFAMYFLEIDF
ncbi:MAG TPA: ABC transporter permease [Steroidobacteraceae bacterium]|nr:ABC transporter permease [Steroidobacteraceae bacterium]